MMFYKIYINYLYDKHMMWSCSVISSSTLCDPMDCSPPGSSVHGMLQARVLEGVAICFSNDKHIAW